VLRPLLALVIASSFTLAAPAQPATPTSSMLDAVRAFVATLNPAQKSKAMLLFNSDERFHWRLGRRLAGGALSEFTASSACKRALGRRRIGGSAGRLGSVLQFLKGPPWVVC